jgi:hypothetical protein
MVVDLVLEAGIALASAPGWRSRTIERPFGMIRRLQTRRARDWPKEICASYCPRRRAPCGISRTFPVGLS